MEKQQTIAVFISPSGCNPALTAEGVALAVAKKALFHMQESKKQQKEGASHLQTGNHLLPGKP